MMAHTPGPWAINADGVKAGPDDGFQPFGACGCCGSPWMSGDSEHAQADANLIVAAPELLELLRYMVKHIGDPMALETRDKFRAAAALVRRLDGAA